jgi:hypothetical protein
MRQSREISYIDGNMQHIWGNGKCIDVLIDLMEESQGNSPLGRGIYRWEDNMNIYWRWYCSWSLRVVDVGSVTDVSEIHSAPMFRVEVSRAGECPCTYPRTHARVCGHRSLTNPHLSSLEFVGQNPIEDDSPAVSWLHPVDVGSMRLRSIANTVDFRRVLGPKSRIQHQQWTTTRT